MPLTRLELQRIKQLEEQLELLYDKRNTFETDIAISASANEKFELRQRLKREVLPNLHRAAREYAQPLAGAVEPSQLSEPEAWALVEDMRVALVSHIPPTSGEQSEELRRLLTDIRAKLDEPGKAAAAKLKVVLPLIPLIASYELEVDTESLVIQVWHRIRDLFRSAVSYSPL